MNASKLWITVLALASVVVLALGWVVGVSPQLDAMVSAQQQRADVIQQNLQHGADLVGLKEQFEQIDVSRRDLAQMRKAVPATWQQEDVIQMAREIADELGVKIQTITWDASVAYAPASSGGAVAPAPASTEESTDGSAAQPVAPSTIPSEDPTAGIVAVDPADAALLTGKFVAVPVTIGMLAEYPQLPVFMSRLRDESRLFVVTGATYPIAGSGDVATISGLVYVVPGPTP